MSCEYCEQFLGRRQLQCPIACSFRSRFYASVLRSYISQTGPVREMQALSCKGFFGFKVNYKDRIYMLEIFCNKIFVMSMFDVNVPCYFILKSHQEDMSVALIQPFFAAVYPVLKGLDLLDLIEERHQIPDQNFLLLLRCAGFEAKADDVSNHACPAG